MNGMMMICGDLMRKAPFNITIEDMPASKEREMKMQTQ